VVEAEARADVLRDQVHLPGVHRRDALLAGAEAELAIDRVPGVLEGLRVDLRDQLGLVEVVRTDLDRRLRGLAGRSLPRGRAGRDAGGLRRRGRLRGGAGATAR